jgi:hypothetical protein
MALLLGMSFRQPTRQRLIICLSFCVEFWVHAIASEYMTDMNYYLSGGIFTSFVLIGIILFAKPNKFTDMMFAACLTSIFINIYGGLLYKNYWNGRSYDMAFQAYDIAFYILYMIVAIIFMQKRGAEDHGSRYSRIGVSYFKQFVSCFQVPEKEERGKAS